MSDTSLPTYLPAAEDVSRREAADLVGRVTTAIAAGAVRETPTLDVAADRLQAVAQQGQRVPQAARDAARAAASSADASARLGASQLHQQLAQRPARVGL